MAFAAVSTQGARKPRLPTGRVGGVKRHPWAAAFAGGLFGARIAYSLTPPCPRRPWAPVVAAVFAAAGVLGLFNYGHYFLIANADPMEVTLCLAAIDSHLCRRPRLTWLLLVL